MSKVEMNGKFVKADCSEIKVGDFIKGANGDPSIVTSCDKTYEDITVVNLTDGQRDRFVNGSNSDTLVVDKLESGSIEVSPQPVEQPSNNSINDAIRNYNS
jgi:hypothetical protein